MMTARANRHEPMDTPLPADGGTIIILSNRGPHTFVWEDGRWIVKPRMDGFVSMIEPLARQPNVAWFCCVSEPPGIEAERDALYTTAKDQTDPDLNVVPVPLPASMYQDYYQRISNAVLWTVQHHLAGQFGHTAFDEKRHLAWESYLEASRRMAQAVVDTAAPPLAFLIQDYHLYPLAALLREKFPGTPSLHFIHIPFPDPSVLRLLPDAWRRAVLNGLLGADVVGLQTPADARAFLACCEELLGVAVDYRKHVVILPSGRTVRVLAFATSIDPEAIAALQSSPEVLAARADFTARQVPHTILRVDRIDPSKNQILGFRAFGRLLELRPDLVGSVRFRAVLLPSRTDEGVYRKYREAVLREAAEVNAKYREACGSDPIEILYTNDRAMTVAAMEVCDVFLANSRQDGMNLAVKEWAVLSTKPGVLVISEMAGPTHEHTQHALLISPLDVEGTARAMAEALSMPAGERAARLEGLRAGVKRWTARDWLAAQMRELGLSLHEKPRTPDATPIAARTAPGVVECEMAVTNQQGIHARPAAMFVRCAREFDGEIDIVRDGESFSAKSIMAILTANLNCGTKFILRASGPGAERMVQQLRELLARFEQEGL